MWLGEGLWLGLIVFLEEIGVFLTVLLHDRMVFLQGLSVLNGLVVLLERLRVLLSGLVVFLQGLANLFTAPSSIIFIHFVLIPKGVQKTVQCDT